MGAYTRRVERGLTGWRAEHQRAESHRARRLAHQAARHRASARIKGFKKANRQAWNWAKAHTKKKAHVKGAWKPFRKHSSPGVAHVSEASLRRATKRLLPRRSDEERYGRFADKTVLVKEICHKSHRGGLGQADSF